jgi:hypothetical protein
MLCQGAASLPAAGPIDGKVISISPDAITQEKTPEKSESNARMTATIAPRPATFYMHFVQTPFSAILP